MSHTNRRWVARVRESEMKFCGGCGQAVDPASRFCTACGAPSPRATGSDGHRRSAGSTRTPAMTDPDTDTQEPNPQAGWITGSEPGSATTAPGPEAGANHPEAVHSPTGRTQLPRTGSESRPDPADPSLATRVRVRSKPMPSEASLGDEETGTVGNSRPRCPTCGQQLPGAKRTERLRRPTDSQTSMRPGG